MRVEKNIVVERPIETVFAFLTDMHKVKLWLPIDNIRQTSSGPIGVGSTFAQEAQFLGQRFAAHGHGKDSAIQAAGVIATRVDATRQRSSFFDRCAGQARA